MRIRNDGTVSRLLRDVELPRMFHAAQSFPDAHIEREAIQEAIFHEIERAGVADRVKPGMRVAMKKISAIRRFSPSAARDMAVAAFGP